MFDLSGIHEINIHAYRSGLLVINFIVFLILCDVGRASIAVYESHKKIEDFDDVELSYTIPIRRNGIEGLLVAAYPLHACVNISSPPVMNLSVNWFVLISESTCNFETKIINAKLAGYSASIIYTYRSRIENLGNRHGHYGFYSNMPAVIINSEDGLTLKRNYLFTESKLFRLVIFPNNVFGIMTFLLLFSIIAGLFLLVMLAFTVIRFFQQVHLSHGSRLSSQHLRQLRTTTFHKGDQYETCVICLEDYKDQDKLRILPCSHGYHTKCIDPWLTNNRRICPVCKRKVILTGENPRSNFEETTPLLQATTPAPHGTFNHAYNPVMNLDCNMPRSFASSRNMQSSTSASTSRPSATEQERQCVLNFQTC